METHTNLKINTRTSRPAIAAGNTVAARPEAVKKLQRTSKNRKHRIHILDIVIILLIVADLTLSGIFAYYFYNNILL